MAAIQPLVAFLKYGFVAVAHVAGRLPRSRSWIGTRTRHGTVCTARHVVRARTFRRTRLCVQDAIWVVKYPESLTPPYPRVSTAHTVVRSYASASEIHLILFLVQLIDSIPFNLFLYKTSCPFWANHRPRLLLFKYWIIKTSSLNLQGVSGYVPQRRSAT